MIEKGSKRAAHENRFLLHLYRPRQGQHRPLGTAAGTAGFRTAPQPDRADAEDGPRRHEPLYQAILAKLDPRQVADDLHRLTDPHEPVLLCWNGRPSPVELVPSANGCGVV